MRSPPALRELNVGADRRAQLILRIMRIPCSILWNKYTRYTVHCKHYNSYIIEEWVYAVVYSTWYTLYIIELNVMKKILYLVHNVIRRHLGTSRQYQANLTSDVIRGQKCYESLIEDHFFIIRAAT